MQLDDLLGWILLRDVGSPVQHRLAARRPESLDERGVKLQLLRVNAILILLANEEALHRFHGLGL